MIHDSSKVTTGGSGGPIRVSTRVIYRVEGDTLFVASIGKRNDSEVYRRFSKK